MNAKTVVFTLSRIPLVDFDASIFGTWDIFWQPVVCFDLSPVELPEHYSNLRIHGGIYGLVSIEYSLPPA